MKPEIEHFIAQLNTIKCSKSIEFRLHFQKKYLKYRENNCAAIEADLIELIKNYNKVKSCHVELVDPRALPEQA